MLGIRKLLLYLSILGLISPAFPLNSLSSLLSYAIRRLCCKHGRCARTACSGGLVVFSSTLFQRIGKTRNRFKGTTGVSGAWNRSPPNSIEC